MLTLLFLAAAFCSVEAAVECFQQHWKKRTIKLPRYNKKPEGMNGQEKPKRLTRSLSAPRRCNSCRKMVYFTALRCKDCGNVTHESCATDCAHQCPAVAARRSSYQPRTSGCDPEINETASPSIQKKSTNLTVPEFASNSLGPRRPAPPLALAGLASAELANRRNSTSTLSTPSHSAHSPVHFPSFGTSGTASQSPSPVSSPSPSSSALTLSGLLKVVHWLSQRRRSREYSKANAADKHVKSKFGLNQDSFDEKIARKRLKSLLKNAGSHKRNSIGSPYSSHQSACYANPAACHCGRVHVEVTHTNSHYQGRPAFHRQTSLTNSRQAFLVSPHSSLSSSGCLSSASSAAQTPSDTEMSDTNKPVPSTSTGACRHTPTSLLWSNTCPPSIIEPSLAQRSYSSGACTYRTDSTASRLTLSPISSVVSSEVFLRSSPSPVPEPKGSRHEHVLHGEMSSHGGDVFDSLVPSKQMPPDERTLSQHGRFGRHCFAHKARTFSIETRGAQAERLCATWPPVGKGNATIDELLDDSESGIGDCDNIIERRKSQSESVKETLGEWCIPYQDLEFKEKLVHGVNGDIFRGRWHGEVLIYKFHQTKDAEVQQFLEDVSRLSLIRHENILLFMGACVEPSHLAIITSMRKGPSLHEQIHLKKHSLPMHTKFSIARQVAQGMSYLHAKGILHRKLSSRNVILESRVKLCIMDQAMVDGTHNRPDFGCIPRGYLCYLSPELMQTLRVDPPRISCKAPNTQESDVYAFGTLLYEILSESFPFQCQAPHSIIWQIANGKHATVNEIKCTSGIRTLLLECWETCPSHRPSFSYISRQLQENVSLRRRHSTSEPERLNRTGLQTSLAICA